MLLYFSTKSERRVTMNHLTIDSQGLQGVVGGSNPPAPTNPSEYLPTQKTLHDFSMKKVGPGPELPVSQGRVFGRKRWG